MGEGGGIFQLTWWRRLAVKQTAKLEGTRESGRCRVFLIDKRGDWGAGFGH